MGYWTIISYQCFFLLIFLELSIVNANNETSVTNTNLKYIEGRIVNGTKAKKEQFPFIVSLHRVDTKSFFCGGSIISPKWVITAAHCMFLNSKLVSASALAVIGGSLQLNPISPNGQLRYIEKRLLNPKYNEDPMTHDIALLLLIIPFNMNQHVNMVPLSIKMPEPDTYCSAAGWGIHFEGSPNPSNDLLYINLPILHQKVCKKLLSKFIQLTPGMLCAGYIQGGKDACQGDSGGPLVCKGLLTGLVSGGLGCARPALPGFYTKVSHYVNWINQVINSNGTNTSYVDTSEIPNLWGSMHNNANLMHCNIIYFFIIFYLFL